jgi:hypothetical protein
MEAARKLGIVLLLLVSYLTPAMACGVSDVQMSTEERACCIAMKKHCEQMEMPTSHGCCQKMPQSAHDNALDTKVVTCHSIVVTTVWLTTAQWLNPALVLAGWVEHTDDLPPQSPSSIISVLRI